MRLGRLSVLITGCLYSQENFVVLISVRGCVNPMAVVRPVGLCQWKIPMTPSGIEPATFRLVAQCFNHLRHRVPLMGLGGCLLAMAQVICSRRMTVKYFYFFRLKKFLWRNLRPDVSGRVPVTCCKVWCSATTHTVIRTQKYLSHLIWVGWKSTVLSAAMESIPR